MKKCYVAIGGVGCRALKKFAIGNGDETASYYYFDTDTRKSHEFQSSDFRFVFSDYPYGKGCLRTLGRDMFKKYLYTDEIPDIVDDSFITDEVELCLITTSFGGFGSAVVFELADYLSARIFKKNQGQTKLDLRIIAFSQELFADAFSHDEALKKSHSINTFEFINEYKSLSARSSKFFPEFSLYVIYSPWIKVENFPEIIGMSSEELKKYDIKDSYLESKRPKTKDVFISYSTVWQSVADKLADKLEECGIGSWIATRDMDTGGYAGQIVRAITGSKVFVVLISNSAVRSDHVMSEVDIAFSHLRDGMVMIPFFLEDTELNDDCKYYLNRQEHFDGRTPPIDERIQTLCEKIKSILEC